jgi:hypothetical protein
VRNIPKFLDDAGRRFQGSIQVLDLQQLRGTSGVSLLSAVRLTRKPAGTLCVTETTAG